MVLLADANGFIALAGVLRSPKPTTMRLESAVGRSAVEPLVYLRLEIAAQLLSVSVSGDAVTLRGARHDYSRIASEIEEFIELNDLEEPGVHMHIDTEATPTEPPLLASDSRELILAGLVRDDVE